eukprot:13298058-Alexandrium_andersonii.AAC.1
MLLLTSLSLKAVEHSAHALHLSQSPPPARLSAYALVDAATCATLRLRLLGVHLECLPQRHAEGHPLLEHGLQP